MMKMFQKNKDESDSKIGPRGRKYSVGNSSMGLHSRTGVTQFNPKSFITQPSSSVLGVPVASSSLIAPWPRDIEFAQYNNDDYKTSNTSFDVSIWKTLPRNESDMPYLVTNEDLKHHKTKVNGWIAINEQVWDISGFVDRHPGGLEMISKGLGKDATKLFDNVHPHIKVENEIGVSFVGIYMTNELKRVNIMKLEKSYRKRLLTSLSSCSRCFNCKKSNETKITVKFKENINFTLVEATASQANIDSSNLVTFGPWSWTVILIEARYLQFRALLEPPNNCWCAEYKLQKELQREFLYFNFKDNYRTIQILFKKPRPRLWKGLGNPIRSKKHTIAKCEEFDDDTICYMFDKKYVSASMFIVGLKIRPSSYIGFPPGHFITLNAKVDGHRSSETYCPLPYTMVSEPEPTCKERPGQSVYLLMKLTEEDNQARSLREFPLGIGTEADISLSIGRTFGDFSLSYIDDADVVVLLAHDTGIAPFCSIIQFYLEKAKDTIEDRQIVLLYFNYSEQDCVWKNEWNYLSDGCSWFHVFLCVENPSATWDQLTGSVSRSLIKACLRAIPDIFSELKIKAVASGHEGFLDKCETAFSKMDTFFDQTYLIRAEPPLPEAS